MGLSARATNSDFRGKCNPRRVHGPCKIGALRAKIWHGVEVDRFDRLLLNLLQRDAGRTAESLAEDVPLSPSAIARRLRRLRADGTIARIAASLSPRIIENRLRAVVTVQLHDHGSVPAILALKKQLRETPQVQFFYETAGSIDFVVVFDCANMSEFNALVFDRIIGNTTVRHHECHFILHELKGEQFVDLLGPDGANEKGAAQAQRPSHFARTGLPEEIVDDVDHLAGP